MRTSTVLQALSRREMLVRAGLVPAALALGGLTVACSTTQDPNSSGRGSSQPQPGGAIEEQDFDDSMIDAAFVRNGGWGPSRYGSDDQRGTLNEVTSEKTAAALALLGGSPVRTYDLSERLFNGFPALATPEAPRIYEQRLFVSGFDPGPGFDGILGPTTPRASNEFTSVEERFPLGGTYQIGTQLDNLNHIAVGDYFYNGFRGADIAVTSGTTKLGAEHIGPIVTRGILLDVLSDKQEGPNSADLVQAPNGRYALREDYRITVEDLKAALERAGVARIEPGDVVLIRTGWNQMLYSDPKRFTGFYPGVYLREARWLAQFRPAIVGADTWGVELLAGADVEGFAQCHQEFIVRNGIRLQESVMLDDLARDGVYEFVYVLTPPKASGATAINAGPAALVPA